MLGRKKLILNYKNMTNNWTIVYPGSYDPWTYWHESVAKDFFEIFPDYHLDVLIWVNPNKSCTFSPNERKLLIEKSLEEEISDRVSVIIHEWLIADYVYENNRNWILKWARDEKDFAYEKSLAQATWEFSNRVRTILIPQINPIHTWISSSQLKSISEFWWNTNNLASPIVREALRMRQSWKFLIWVTWWIASWKSTLCKKLEEYSKWKEIEVIYINFDEITREIHTRTDLPIFQEIRNKIANAFWKDVLNKDWTTNKKILAKIVFSNSSAMERLMDIILEPLMYFLRKKIESSKPNSIILVEWAIIFDRDLTHLFDENIINIWVDNETQIKRIKARDNLSNDEIKKRLDSQLPREERLSWIKSIQEKYKKQDRLLIDIDSENGSIEEIYEELIKEYNKRKSFDYK